MSNELAIPESAEAAVSAALARLTKTQLRRVLARADGATLQQIADSEGCSASAIDQSLKSQAVRDAMSVLGYNLTVARGTKNDVAIIDPVLIMLENLLEIATNATRALVVSEGSGVTRAKEVPDYPTRLAATAKFLSLVDRGPSSRPQATAEAPARPSVELEQTQTTSTSRRVRVS